MNRRGFLFLPVGAALGAQKPPTGLDEPGYRKLLAAHKGRVVLVNFWATWCEPCRAEMPQLVRLASKYRQKGFALITVSCDEPDREAQAAGFLASNAVPGPTYIKRVEDDDKFIASVDAKWSGALPALFLYDRQGRKARSFVGETEIPALEAAIQKLL